MKLMKDRSAPWVLYPYLKKHVWHLVGVLTLVVIVVSIDLLQPVIMKEAIDKYIAVPSPDANSLLVISGIYLAAVILSFWLTYYQNILLQSTGQRIIRQIREDLFSHIQDLSLKYFDRNPSGRIVTNVANDTEALNSFFTDFLANNLRNIFTLVMIVVFMFQLDMKIAIYCMLVVPLIVIVSAYFQKRIRKVNQEMRGRMSSLIAFLAENLAGMSIIQIFNQQGKQLGEFNNRNTSLLASTLRENRLSLAFFFFSEIISDLGVAAIVWFGSGPVIRGDVSFGVLFAFIGYIRRFVQPINAITTQLNTFQNMLVASERIVATFNEKPDIVEARDAVVPPSIRGEVVFSNTFLAYREGVNVLKGISLEIKPGEKVGFVGASGAGKTSLMSLLARFYDATGGTVSIDGNDIRKWPLDQLYKTVGIVQQDITLFTGSVADNIRFFHHEITPGRITDVCKLIGAHDFISKLPRGYDTMLTDRAATLSFGERQLLSFARAMVFEPRVLILDEATASLDSNTEAVLQEAIARMSAGRTLLFIAHRLSTVLGMDYIVVLDDGLIVEKGSHEELLSKNGHYTSLHNSSVITNRSGA